MRAFVPKGHLPLSAAVDAVCRERFGGDPALLRSEPWRGAGWQGAVAGVARVFGRIERVRAGEMSNLDALEEAEAALRQAFGDGDLPTVALDDGGGPPVLIPAELWQGAEACEAFRTGRVGCVNGVTTLDGSAPRAKAPRPMQVAGRVLVKETDLSAWLRGEPVQASPVSVAGSVVAPAPANKGGRPAKWDWVAFDAEVVRLANTLDGLPPRPQLLQAMLEWCGRTWGDEPSESTVRDRIARLYPE